MRRKMFIRKDDEGVSPVIATILMVAITVVLAAVLYIMVITIEPPSNLPPIGKLAPPYVKGPTEVDIEIASMSREPEPINFEILLMRNETVEGKYGFSSNNDGVLILMLGTDVGTLTYADIADNKIVNKGDEIRMTNLSPGSDYTLTLIWAPTGEKVDSTTFRTIAQ